MKPKFEINQAVRLNTLVGTVKEIAPFADHFEYLVIFGDGTGSWYHESKLSPSTLNSKPSTKR